MQRILSAAERRSAMRTSKHHRRRPASPLRLRKLPRSFYLQPTLRVARQLLGMYLVRDDGRERLVGKIVEVEAYLGEQDPASHAYKGMTERNEVMFWQGGHLYVYFIYGMHYCCNVVTERQGVGHAILLRAAEPVAGIATMARNRGLRLNSERDLALLCSGPARLCQAFGIGRKENGTDLCGEKIWIAAGSTARALHRIGRSRRVGIVRAVDHPWRFFIRGSRFVSPAKPARSS